DVTPCPYMPVTAGNLRERSFADLWRDAPVFGDLRDPKLGGRCGACEFSKICGGCRCRAYATHADYLAEDPACGYQPGGHGGAMIDLPASLTFGLPVDYQLVWDEDARARLQAIPSFARGMVIKAVEAYARGRGERTITKELLSDVRSKWGSRFRAPAWHVLKVAVRPETASVAAPWGGEVTFRVGAIVFLIVTVAALLVIGRAAWAKEAA